MNIMTKRGSQDNIVTYEHYCDTKADLANIPQDQISLGSVAIILKDEDDSMGIYLANSSKEWIPFSNSGSSGDSSSESSSGPILEWTQIVKPEDVFEYTPSSTSGAPGRHYFVVPDHFGWNKTPDIPEWFFFKVEYNDKTMRNFHRVGSIMDYQGNLGGEVWFGETSETTIYGFTYLAHFSNYNIDTVTFYLDGMPPEFTSGISIYAATVIGWNE